MKKNKNKARVSWRSNPLYWVYQFIIITTYISVVFVAPLSRPRWGSPPDQLEMLGAWFAFATVTSIGFAIAYNITFKIIKKKADGLSDKGKAIDRENIMIRKEVEEFKREIPELKGVIYK